MSNTAIKIREIAAEVLGIAASEVVEPATFASFGADDLDTTEVIMEIEREFKIAIADEMCDNLKTVGELITHVEELLK